MYRSALRVGLLLFVVISFLVVPASFGQATTHTLSAGLNPSGFWGPAALIITPIQPLTAAAISEPIQYWGDQDWRNKKKKHVEVPEGGPALVYLGLAGIACFGAFVLTRRRRESERSTGE
jgi:hypothetical protein